MDRRRFLASSACVAAACGASRSSLISGLAAPQSISLRIDPRKVAGVIPSGFMGLGYEISSVARPGLLSATNTVYVQLVNNLGTSGVIRIGGNTSDYSTYSKDGAPDASPKSTVVNESQIRDLGAFLEATGWQLIWGINLGGRNMNNAVEEAQSVAAAAGRRLLAIEIGNEPDLFAAGEAHRAKGYSYADYLREYRSYKSALRARLPNVPLAGPDVARSTDWLTQFAIDEGADLKLLTHHYYAEGPPQSPASTMDKLLQTDEKLARILEQCELASRRTSVPYRICETNSCFGGGRPGVSDTLASALWGLDFLCTLAVANAAGANLETGVNQLGFVSSYSPIDDNQPGSFTTKPLYYGMLAFAQASRGRRVSVEYDAAGMNIKAYAVRGDDGRLAITLINKEARTAASIRIAMAAAQFSRGRILRLTGPSLDSKNGIALGGATVAADGKWASSEAEQLRLVDGEGQLSLPAASAAIVILEQ